MSDERLGAVRQSVLAPSGPCRTAPDGADEGKADRPLSRAVSALRPWPKDDLPDRA
jgi:hypothetical protein